MLKKELPIKDLALIYPRLYQDSRGAFYEKFNKYKIEKLLDRKFSIKQINSSCSFPGVIRGIHYQLHTPQGKLISVKHGKILDIAVDLRRSSSTFGAWAAILLDVRHTKMFWIPPGFGHGFSVLDHSPAEVIYYTTNYWDPKDERCIRWNDPTLNIDWKIENPIVSEKDQSGKFLEEAEVYL